MRNILKLTTLIVLLICIEGNAQKTYILAGGGGHPNSIYRLNNDYTVSLITFLDSTLGLNDIAISPEGEFYGMDIMDRIVKIDTATGSFTFITQIPSLCSSKGLVCSNDNEIYILCDNLLKYNLLTDSLEIVANNIGNTPGDLSFYKGNIIFQSCSDGHIKAFNPEIQSLETILCIDLPFPNVEFWGISNIHEDCNSEKVYAFSNWNHMYELDFDNNSTIHLIFDNSALGTQCILGSATTTEHISSTCTGNVIDSVDCYTSVCDIDLNSNILIYPNPTSDILRISATSKIDFIEIYSIHGKAIEQIPFPNNEINLNHLNKGIYFIRIKSEYQTITRKIMKQ